MMPTHQSLATIIRTVDGLHRSNRLLTFKDPEDNPGRHTLGSSCLETHVSPRLYGFDHVRIAAVFTMIFAAKDHDAVGVYLSSDLEDRHAGRIFHKLRDTDDLFVAHIVHTQLLPCDAYFRMLIDFASIDYFLMHQGRLMIQIEAP